MSKAVVTRALAAGLLASLLASAAVMAAPFGHTPALGPDSTIHATPAQMRMGPHDGTHGGPMMGPGRADRGGEADPAAREVPARRYPSSAARVAGEYSGAGWNESSGKSAYPAAFMQSAPALDEASNRRRASAPVIRPSALIPAGSSAIAAANPTLSRGVVWSSVSCTETGGRVTADVFADGRSFVETFDCCPHALNSRPLVSTRPESP